MARVKRGNVARKRRKKVLKLTKGFRGSISKLFRPAHQALLHALNNSYRDRRRKKRTFRSLWIARMNAALDRVGISYSKFMGDLKKNNIAINRKMLAEIAIHHNDALEAVIKESGNTITTQPVAVSKAKAVEPKKTEAPKADVKTEETKSEATAEEKTSNDDNA